MSRQRNRKQPRRNPPGRPADHASQPQGTVRYGRLIPGVPDTRDQVRIIIEKRPL